MADDRPVKYAIVLIDGSADYPLERIGGRTPLMAANTPLIDQLAAEGRCGTLSTVPDGMTPDSAVANLSVLGYDPVTTYQGRGVLEAASLGVDLADEDVAMRCNLISLDDGKVLDHSSGHISTEEAAQLLEALQPILEEGVELHPGVSYRHLLVLRGGRYAPEIECWPPHDHVGKPIADMPIRATSDAAEPTAALLNRLTEASQPILADHPVNRARREAGKRTADTLLFWAPGRRPTMDTLQDRFGIEGAVISAVDLIRGLGRYAGMESILVEGATGLYDTNYEGKAQAALDALADHDLVFVHLEGPDEAGHARDLGLKIYCLESIDRRLLKPLWEGMKERGYRRVVAVLPDHFTPVERGDHVGEPVPVLIRDPDRDPDGVTQYDERSVEQGALGQMRCEDFVRTLLWRKLP
ncbi:MAG: cofactor-independent phosphoglycerate mutase [Deltaproteobacteria bacterium]|jgi:2,3-bisphosphoglycerate-independent phosphoglycerate mutase|nr:cofactor-independent phosphoglycerate mutase [Deltaproteobacteria bacterium]MBW2534130.1 cofactor-independent phosphoglycerate mutase [Deltaproteobacteria bacterium]